MHRFWSRASQRCLTSTSPIREHLCQQAYGSDAQIDRRYVPLALWTAQGMVASSSSIGTALWNAKGPNSEDSHFVKERREGAFSLTGSSVKQSLKILSFNVFNESFLFPSRSVISGHA